MAVVALGWLSLLMPANAALHVTATVVHRSYAPGTVTATVLYTPYFFWFLSLTIRRLKPGWVAVATAMILGALPMLETLRLLLEFG